MEPTPNGKDKDFVKLSWVYKRWPWSLLIGRGLCSNGKAEGFNLSEINKRELFKKRQDITLHLKSTLINSMVGLCTYLSGKTHCRRKLICCNAFDSSSSMLYGSKGSAIVTKSKIRLIFQTGEYTCT